MNPASNLILIGPMGAGKSTIGKRLALRLGLSFLDLDDWIEDHCGATIPLIFEVEGEAGFRKREHEALVDAVKCGGRLIATGGGCVLREDNREVIRGGGFVVWLAASVEEQLRRLARDRKRPLLRAPDREARLRTLAAERDPIYAGLADFRYLAGATTPERAAADLAHRLDGAWQRLAADHVA